jgi:hypothetical protein
MEMSINIENKVKNKIRQLAGFYFRCCNINNQTKTGTYCRGRYTLAGKT